MALCIALRSSPLVIMCSCLPQTSGRLLRLDGGSEVSESRSAQLESNWCVRVSVCVCVRVGRRCTHADECVCPCVHFYSNVSFRTNKSMIVCTSTYTHCEFAAYGEHSVECTLPLHFVCPLLYTLQKCFLFILHIIKKGILVLQLPW